MKTKHHGQMSESFLTAVFLSLSGGLQDAYTYLFRGKVFANAQTGNIVLLSSNIMDGQWDRVLHYLVPLCAFALGVLVAEKMRENFRDMQRLHWRQLVVLGEVLLLFIVGFLPQEQNLLANAIVSFSCAMQVQAFRKVNGYAFASTMCIGDLRSGVEAFCIWSKTHEPKVKDRMMRYFGIILLFAVGAGIGSMGAARLAGKTIWISCGLLLSRVARTIRTSAALGGSTAVTLVVPAMEWMSMLPGISSSRHRPTPITPEHIPIMKVSALNTSETLCLDAPMARRIPISLRRSSTLI